MLISVLRQLITSKIIYNAVVFLDRYDILFFVYFFGGLQCVGHSFAYVAHFVLLRDVWIRTQGAAVASRRATNLATHLPSYDIRNVFECSTLHISIPAQ
jgi:hypothetical protein